MKVCRYSEIDSRLLKLANSAKEGAVLWPDYLHGVSNCMIAIRVVKKRQARLRIRQQKENAAKRVHLSQPLQAQSTSPIATPLSQPLYVPFDLGDSDSEDFE